MAMVQGNPFEIEGNIVPLGSDVNVTYYRSAKPAGCDRAILMLMPGSIYRVGDSGAWLLAIKQQDLVVELPSDVVSIYSTAGMQVEWLPSGSQVVNRAEPMVLIGRWLLLPAMPIASGQYFHLYLEATNAGALFNPVRTTPTASNAYDRALSIDVREYRSLLATVHSEATIAGQSMAIAGGLHQRSTTGASASSWLSTGTPAPGTQSPGNGSPIELRQTWNLDTVPAPYFDFILGTSGGVAFAAANMGGECTAELWGVPRAF